MFYPIHTANLNAIKAMGRSDLFLKLEIAKKMIGMILLVSTMWFGVMAMAGSLLVSTVTSMIINSWPNKKLLNYSFREQIQDILPAILIALLMGAAVYAISLFRLPDIAIIFIQIPLGAMLYIVFSIMFKLEEWDYLKRLMLNFVAKAK